MRRSVPRRWLAAPATVALAVVAAVVAISAAASASPKGKPHLSEREILGIAVTAAAGAGDPRPVLIQHSEGTREQANLVDSGDIVPGRQWSYLIAVRGHFVFTRVSRPSGSRPPTGSVLTLVVNARTRQTTDSGLSNRYPDLAHLGPVTTDLRRRGPALRASVIWTPPAVAAGPIGEMAGAMARGTLVPAGDFNRAALAPNGSTRVFTDSEHGYALAFIRSGTYPARTVDAGKTWRVDGPAFHVDAAQGGLGVGEMGVASDAIAFAWGGVTPDTVIDVTTDGGTRWWQAFMPGPVLFVGHEGPALVANVYGSVTQGHTTHTGLWAYQTTTGRRWTYVNTLS